MSEELKEKILARDFNFETGLVHRVNNFGAVSVDLEDGRGNLDIHYHYLQHLKIWDTSISVPKEAGMIEYRMVASRFFACHFKDGELFIVETEYPLPP